MTAQNHTDPLLGTRLGDYVLQELMGRGGMARVYRGLDEAVKRPAAIKVLDSTAEELQDERIVERFRLEAQAIANFEHPNIITLYQYGEADHFFFIAMKLVQGQTLARVLREARRQNTYLPPQRVLEIVRDVCAALDYAHARGIIHRDIKPSNILFDENANNRAILTDFGLAMEIGGEKTLGTAFGTPRYISPEQAVSSQQAVPQSDIYSLAVVVYEMLCGQVPFQDDSPMSIALYHITSTPPPPRKFNPAIPAEVEKVVLRALSKEPDDRYATAGAFYQALEDAYMQAEIDLPTLSIPPDPETMFFPADDSTANLPPSEPSAPARPRRAFWRRPRPAAAGAAPATPDRRGLPLLARIILLLTVIFGLVGFWWANGQSLVLPPVITDTIRDVVEAIRLDGGVRAEPGALPADVEIALELLVDANRLAIRNRTAYQVPLDGLTIEWRVDGRRHTYSAEAFHGALPPGQCAWLRLLSRGTLHPPEGCPSPAYHLTLLRDSADLTWAAAETFRVLYHGDEITTCAFAGGRCAFVLPR